MRRLAYLLIFMAPAALATPPAPGRDIRAGLKAGETIEGRADGDLNGDGLADTAYVVRGDDRRTLHVRLGGRGDAAGSAALDPFPQGPAEMTIDNGVLVVKDLTGGTTATAITYRFRGQKDQPRLKLIGVDATTASRTFAHDGQELSWNLLTGDVITATLKLVGSGENASYAKRDIKRFRRPVQTVWMEDTPDSESLFGAVQ